MRLSRASKIPSPTGEGRDEGGTRSTETGVGRDAHRNGSERRRRSTPRAHEATGLRTWEGGEFEHSRARIPADSMVDEPRGVALVSTPRRFRHKRRRESSSYPAPSCSLQGARRECRDSIREIKTARLPGSIAACGVSPRTCNSAKKNAPGSAPRPGRRAPHDGRQHDVISAETFVRPGEDGARSSQRAGRHRRPDFLAQRATTTVDCEASASRRENTLT